MSLWSQVCAVPAFGPRRWFGVLATASDDRSSRMPARADAPGRADERRFREQMLPHLDAAYTLARYLLRDVTAAEDVVQEAFLRAYRAFPSYRGGQPKAWILTIVRNTAFTWRKAATSEAKRTADSHAFEGAADPFEHVADPDQENAEASLVRQDEIAAVRRAIADLPEPFRETLVLRELQELSYKEIATLTAAPIGTVMSRLARARTMLAEVLRIQGGAP